MERVVRAADASLTVLNIMTSKKMPKPVYLGLCLQNYFHSGPENLKRVQAKKTRENE